MLAPAIDNGALLMAKGSHRPPNQQTKNLPLALNREDGMKWRVMVELGGAEGTVQMHEVAPRC